MKRAMLAAIGLLSLSVFVLAAAAARGTTRYVSPSGVDNPTCSKNRPCNHIQQAVNVASAGDTISLAKGNYREQVSISKNLTLIGAGSGASTISAPAVLAPDSSGFLNIVEINSGASVQMSHLAVTGPGPGTCGSIDRGISVIGGASLAITQAAISDIRDNPGSECNNGFDVGAGTQIRGSQLPPDPEVGHLTIDHTTLTGYQRAAIFVNNVGSTAQIDHNTITGTPCTFPCNGPGGIGVFNGASATIDHNTISGNECNDPTLPCGPDWLGNDYQSWGILMSGAASSTVVSHNSLNANDAGIYTDTGPTIDHNDVASRYFGILTDTGNAAQVEYNSTYGGIYGIYEFGGTGTFSHNSARGSSGADLWWDGTGTPSFSHNSCGTASPSKAIWDCH
jgi:nitrous oxidase accessory protein NosD